MKNYFNPDSTVLYGGAFDPPHEGHAAIAKRIVECSKAQKLLIVPSGPRTDKAYKTAEAHRRMVLECFVADLNDPRIELDCDFLDFPSLGNTTTLGMDAHYAKKFGIRPTQIFGADVVPNMKIWDPAGRVEREVPKILVIRDGKIPETAGLDNFVVLDPKIPKNLRSLSSTEIRARIVNGIYEGLTPKVAAYVKESGAYSDRENQSLK